MSKLKTPIVEVNHGIMNRFADVIEVNRHLRKYPKLYFPILTHELEHSNQPFSLYDLKHDINSHNKVDQIQLLKFMFKHPKSFTQILPFYYTPRRKFVIDINLCIIYSVMLLLGIGIYFWLY
ncbi:hypothetical protein LCGC14_0969550 [marine sediment metagenome]|uniref:Uncharacterized protein n=1 Tax=marine sediment metagenome TaxID=412755 RepID=A0A0F9NY74_9ZZZZ